MKIIISGGGTMGHIKPAMAVAVEYSKNNEVIFIGKFNSMEEREAEKNNISFLGLNTIGFNKKIFHDLKALFLFYLSYLKLKKEIKKINPDVIIGFGGYVSSSVIKAGLKLKKCVYIHEQNSAFGLVNKHYAPKVNKVFLSYEIDGVNNGIITGNPVTSTIKYNKTDLEYKDKPKILFIGGSLGAQKINDIAASLKDKYQVILVCGQKYYEKYKDLDMIVLSYVNDLVSLMIEADIIISRAGATTIQEIISIGKPVILIPSPNVSNNHQEMNASYFFDRGAAEMILEKNLTSESLSFKIDRLLGNSFFVETMISKQREYQIYNSKYKIINEINKDLLIHRSK